MKKIIVLLALIALFATGAFAQISFSAGGGALFDWSFRNGYKFEDSWGIFDDLDGFGLYDYQGLQIMSFGGFGFFDAKYAEADIHLAYGNVRSKWKYDGDSGTFKAGHALQLGISALGKFPISLKGPITIFPLLGVDYNMVLAAWDPDGNKDEEKTIKWYSQFGFLAGAGLDFNLTNRLFLRGEALLHLRLPMKAWKDSEIIPGVTATLGMGPRIKAGVGFRF